MYGPGEGVVKKDFWEELGRVRDRWRMHWILGGDFNTVLFLLERNGGGREKAYTREFKNLVDAFELLDLPLFGGRFTGPVCLVYLHYRGLIYFLSQ